MARHCPPELVKEFNPDSGKNEVSLTELIQNRSVNYRLLYSAQSDLKKPVKLPISQTGDKPLPEFISVRKDLDRHFPDVYITTLKNGLAFGDPDGSVVLTKTHQIIAELSTGNSLLIASSPLPPTKFLDATVAFLCTKWGYSFYHWMTDVLIRLLIVLQSQDIDKIDYFVVDDFQRSYQKQSFDLLGIPKNKVIESRQLGLFEARHLVVPSRPSTPGWIQDWSISLLRDHFISRLELKSEKHNYQDRVYISRSKAGYRKIDNESEIERILDGFGFKKVFFETLTIQDQAKVMANASVIVAPHGAGLTNLIYAKPETKVLEIFPSKYINVCYWTLCNQLDLDYYYLVGESTNPSDYPAKHNIFLKASELDKALCFMLN